MRRLLAVLASCAVLVAATVSSAHAWGRTGHQIVAAIAWTKMTPAARKAAIKLLQAAPSTSGIRDLRPTTGDSAGRDEQWFIATAVWPDLVRTGPHTSYSHPSWHFADHYWKQVNAAAQDITTMGPAKTNAVERLTALTKELGGTSASAGQKAVDLAWVLHLVGDVHQPLHNSSLVTTALPKGDYGGNDFLLGGGTNPPELHAYWDNIFDTVYIADKSDGLTKTKKLAHEKQPAYIQEWATRIVKAYNTSPHDGSANAFDSWSQEGWRLAERDAYSGLTRGKSPSVAYRTRTDSDAEKMVAEAGYRLAALLNATLR